MTSHDDLTALFINTSLKRSSEPSHTQVGLDTDFTRRNTTFMAWNLMHLARMLKDSGGVPAHGNQRTAWDGGERFDHPNPEYR